MRSVAMFVVLVGCATEGDEMSPRLDVAGLPTEQAAVPSGRFMTLGSSRITPGGAVTLVAGGALPGEVVRFARGSSYSAGASCFPALQGLCLNVTAPSLLGQSVANNAGFAELNLQLPNGVPAVGQHVVMVAAVVNPDQTQSNVEPKDVVANAGSVYTVGNTDALEGFSSHSPNYLLGYPVMVVDGGDLVGFGMSGTATGARVRLALYTDSGGVPDRLVAESVGGAYANGVNSFAPVAPATIQRGKYWLMGLYDAQGAPGMGGGSTATPVHYISLAANAAMPDPMPQTSFYTSQTFNYWIALD